MKEVWSKRYGKNPAEGLHKYLENNIKGYKRSKIHNYLKGFADYIGKPEKQDSVILASNNFNKWVRFTQLLNNNINHPGSDTR